MKKIISLFFLTVLLYGCDFISNIFLEKDLLQRPEAKRCGDCHRDIYNQWKNSRHSLSWVSEDYKKRTNHYSKTKCFSCHIPYEIKIGEKPEFREKNKEDGINCVSCHFKDGTKSMHGPYDVFSPPHPSTYDPNYSMADICSGCHQKTYKQWKSTNTEKNCQDCHMPAKKGSLIQKFPFEYLHLPKDVHNHSFPVGRAGKDDISVKIQKKDKKLYIYLLNKGIPHNLPTADNGKPKIYLSVMFYKNNLPINKQMEIFFPAKPLPYKRTVTSSPN